jgi:membrane protease YdiL (CAAX protease family)
MSEITVVEKRLGTRPEPAEDQALQPMPFWLSLLLFAIPAALMVASMFWGIPWLEGLGLEPIVSFLTAFTVPMAWMFTAALVGYHKIERRSLRWDSFAARMRFPRLQFKDLLWGLLVFGVGMVTMALLTPVILAFIEAGWLTVPDNLPLLLDPQATISGAALAQQAGGSLRGRWDIVILFMIYLFFNIAGEELWWRGYILPRQELRHGRRAWMVHGLLWAAFHVFKYWSIITLVPFTLALSFSAQRLKTNWPATFAHLLGNLTFFSLVVMGVLGVF